MTTSISNPILSTWIFISICVVLTLWSMQKKRDEGFSISLTQELKGFAILAVIFSHIGYFLITQHEFLFPLTVFAGVGVNMFLFLSGYGLTIAGINKSETRVQFYKKRMLKVLIPFWIVFIIFLILDYVILGNLYSHEFIIKGFLGIFTSAQIYTDLNSPFWYLSLILFYYLLFPLFFSKKYPWITAIFLYMSTHIIIKLDPRVLENVIELYKTHTIAFPLGIFFAWVCVGDKTKYLHVKMRACLHVFSEKIKDIYIQYRKIIERVSIGILVIAISYFSIHSGVGEDIVIEQNISIMIVGMIILLFFIKKNEFRILSIFGLYSYELYLLHWPIMYRYTSLYAYVPAWLATCIYLLICIGLGWVLKYISQKIFKLF